MNDMTIFNNPEFGDVRTIMIDGGTVVFTNLRGMEVINL